MKKILVPCDFSPTSQQAYQFALNWAVRFGAEVYVLKAIDIPYLYETTYAASPFFFEPSLMKDLEDDSRQSFEKMKANHARKDVTVHFNVIQGPVTQTILEFIRKEGIDLVIMGTQGTSGFGEYLIGSNTEKIVRFSTVPVFAIRKAIELSSIRNIVFPTTLALDQHSSVNKVKELQSLFGATLHLLLVNTPANMRRTLDEKSEMADFVRHYQLQNCTLNIRDDFYEQNAIISFAEEIQADMIVMATHGRRGLAHLFMGSITEDVVNHFDGPVWTCSLRKESR